MKNNYLINQAQLKKYAAFWLVCMIGLLFFATYLLPNSKINSSVLSLLPQEQRSDVNIELINGFQERLDKQLVWLVSPSSDQDTESVSWLYNTLKKQEFIEEINGSYDHNFQQNWGEFAYQYRYQLVDQITINRLINHTQSDWILSQIYSPFSGINVNEINNDPLLLTRSTQMNKLNRAGNLSIKHNYLTVSDSEKNNWYMLYATLKGSSFDMNQSHQIVTKLTEIIDTLKKKWPNTQVLKRGVIYYSDEAATQAKNDITTIGSLSMVGIVILILLIFRSIKPILLAILSIATGLLCGTIAVLTIFGEIHIITIVMSLSIIGVTIDYSIHYLTERLIHGSKESTFTSLNKLLPTLLVALSTSLITYLILLFTPFPGLKQLSIFACFGLSSSFISVILWYPFLVRKMQIRPNTASRQLSFWLTLWKKKTIQWIMVVIALIFIGFGLLNLTIDDDIGRFQSLPLALQLEEQQIVAITKQSTDQKWFIVQGTTPEQTLQKLETFIPELNNAQQAGIFETYHTIDLPSKQRQLKNIDIIDKYASSILNVLQKQGIAVAPLSLAQARNTLITPEEWGESVMSQGQKLLWLTTEKGVSAALIPISGIHDLAALKKLSKKREGIIWLDRRQEFNEMFSNYRTHLTQLLILATAFICFSFIYRNRVNGLLFSLKSTLPTLLSIGCSLSILGITKQPLNLFSLLALILVIGVGIDYSLFLSTDHHQKQSALLAVSMAALTTLLSFGLLVLSHTSAIVGFGLVLVTGIFTAFLFSPLAIKTQKVKVLAR